MRRRRPLRPLKKPNLPNNIEVRPFREFDKNLLHLNIVLSPDRALSPAGSRRLKDRRLLGEGAEFAWPSPAVFFVPEFALKILKVFSRDHHHIKYYDSKIDSEILLLHFLTQAQEQKRFVDLKKLKSEIKEATKLCLIHSNSQRWLTTLQKIEEKSLDPDLTLASKKILLFLELKAFASAQEKALSDWEFIEEAAQFLENSAPLDPENFQKTFREIAERHPFFEPDQKISLHIPIIQELWPLEDRFFKALSRHIKVYYYQSPYRLNTTDSFPLNNLPIQSALEIPQQPKQSDWALAWAHLEERPSHLEALHCIDGDFELDVLIKTNAASNFKLQMLSQFIDFKLKSEPSQHDFRKFMSQPSKVKDNIKANIHELILQWENEWKVPSPHKMAIQAIEETLQSLIPEHSKKLIQNLNSENLVAWLKYISHENKYAEKLVENTFARLSENGLPLLTLQDLPFSGAKNKILQALPEDIEEVFSPLSAHNLSKAIFSHSFVKILLEDNIILPNPKQDAELLLGAFESQKNQISLLSARNALQLSSQAIKPMPTKRLVDFDAFSPSALESWATCSMRFYFEKVHRLAPGKEFNEIPINAINFGNWVHQALESIIPNIPSAVPNFQKILEILEKIKTEIFLYESTPAYLDTLVAEANFIAQKLETHLNNFEIPLSRVLGPRKIQVEKGIRLNWLDRNFKGRFDRLDNFDSGINLLWDYKTGNIKDKRSQTLIKNNKFQWHLYRQLIQASHQDIQAPLVIHGGGYINPLYPNKSHLIAIEDAWNSEELNHFQDICKAAGHRLEVIKSKDENLLDAALKNKLQVIFKEIDDGQLLPKGNINKDCRYCQVRGLCGKPFLESNVSNEADETADSSEAEESAN